MFVLVLLGTFLSVNSYSASTVEMCFNSHFLMDMYHKTYETVAGNMFLQSKLEGKPLAQTFVIPNDNNHCLTADGDDKIVSKIKELYEEKKKELLYPGTTEINNIQVQVHIAGFPEPFLSLPERSSNVLYDTKKNPVTISARMLHPQIIEMTYDAGPLRTIKNFHLNELIYCIYYQKDLRGIRDAMVNKDRIGNFRTHYLKKDNNFIRVESLRLKATLR